MEGLMSTDKLCALMRGKRVGDIVGLVHGIGVARKSLVTNPSQS
jgi:hypothetical protein